MAVTNYHTVNQEIIGETTSASRTGYLTDGLGSITATQNAAGTTLATWRYKPYGALLAKTGGGTDPRFLWAGTAGSRSTLLAYSEYYNRARHYARACGSWTSTDPMWPSESAHIYATSNPVTFIDPSGLSTCKTWHDDGPSRPTTTAGTEIKCFQAITLPHQGKHSELFGIAGCNFQKGLTWACICQDGALFAIVAAHERKHKDILGPCCKQMPACIKDKRRGLAFCLVEYGKWFTANEEKNECLALLAGEKVSTPLYDACTATPFTSSCRLIIDYHLKRLEKITDMSCRTRDLKIPACSLKKRSAGGGTGAGGG